MTSRRFISISREGWYYLFLLSFIIGGAAFRQINLLLILSGLMLGPMIFNWRFVAATMRQVTARRRLPRLICAGDPLVVEIVASNQRTRLANKGLVIQDTVQLEDSPDDRYQTSVEVLIPHVDAGRQATASYRCRLNVRGRYRFGPLRARTRFPLGLVEAAVRIDADDTLVVGPRLGRLTRQWLRLIESEHGGSQRSGRRQGRAAGDYYGLREWRQGDSKRWIHWRTTAKLGELAVLQFEQKRKRDLVLILDLWLPSDASEAQTADVETAVSFAATAVVDACNRGDARVTLAVTGKTAGVWTAPTSPVFATEMLHQLALVNAGDSRALPDVLQRVGGPMHSATRVVVISTRDADAAGPHDEGNLDAASYDLAARERLMWINVARGDHERLFQLD